MELRPATASDRETVFAWRNDPWIVSLSASGKTVSRAEHETWFDRTLADPGVKMFIIEENGRPGGQLRFTREDGQAEISVYLLKEFTGRGLGTQAITQGCAAVFKAWPDLATVRALIRKNNAESGKAFAKAGFAAAGEKDGFFEMVQVRP